MGNSIIHFGGPGQKDGALRDLLSRRIAQVPEGGNIDWVTYYFRDRHLAQDLIDARQRGVNVCITLDGRPRSTHANDEVIRMLKEGLGDGVRAISNSRGRFHRGKLFRPRLHEKIYCFSHPQPVALVGSFNPSGDISEEYPEVIKDIGDHDRAFNLLVELNDRQLVDALVNHCRSLHDDSYGFFDRFRGVQNRALDFDNFALYCWPRVTPDPIYTLLKQLSPRSHVRIVASHFSGMTSLRAIKAAAKRGIKIDLILESTERRVPQHVLKELADAGITIYSADKEREWTPMHDKFMLIEEENKKRCVFGSFNWSEPSRRFNREIGIESSETSLVEQLEQRWSALLQHQQLI